MEFITLEEFSARYKKGEDLSMYLTMPRSISDIELNGESLDVEDILNLKVNIQKEKDRTAKHKLSIDLGKLIKNKINNVKSKNIRR